MAKNLRASIKQSIKASSKASLTGGNVFGSSPLDLRFALQKTLDPRITFTRASTGTYVGSNGLLQSAVTNEARFDHNPTTGESLGLLVEEARTNLVLQSETFGTTWGPFRASIVTNSTASPDGAATADTIVEDTTVTSSHGTSQTRNLTAAVYTFTIFLKAAGRNWVNINPSDSADHRTWFDFSNGAVGTNATGNTSSITAYPNGWYRCTITRTMDRVSCAFQISLTTGDNVAAYSGDGTSGAYIWGAQIEAGAFPTSYIPTTSATATRAADVASITGTNFSSWYNQSAGTLVGEYRTPASGTRGVADFNDNTANERIGMLTNSTDPKMLAVDGGITQVDLDGGTIVANTLAKTAIAYATNDFSIVNAGGAAVTDTSGTLPTVNRLMIGTDQTGNYQNGQTKRLTYWPVRLPDATLQALTAP
jgi:hypothetical protein